MEKDYRVKTNRAFKQSGFTRRDSERLLEMFILLSYSKLISNQMFAFAWEICAYEAFEELPENKTSVMHRVKILEMERCHGEDFLTDILFPYCEQS